MKRLLYFSLLVASFYAGSKYSDRGTYSLSKKDDQWYLSHSTNSYLISSNNGSPQLGSIEHRMEGLLEENLEDLISSLDNITNE